MAGGLLLIFASTNQRHLVNAVLNDDPVGDLRLSNFLNQRYPDRPIYVAAFRTFAFQRVFYFRDRRRNKHIESAFHRDLLKKLHPDEKYVYVMIFPDEFQKPFEQADPRGRFFRFSVNYGIFAN